MGDLVHDLSLGHELRETHISWVFLGDRRVFKVKKPVDFGFLDFRELDDRKRFCEAEVRLNTRLAPDVYLGVVPVTVDDRGRHRIAGEGRVVDWAVEMNRLADRDRADVRLDSGRLDWVHLSALAERLAVFHDSAAKSPAVDAHGRPDAILVNVLENFEQSRPWVAKLISAEEAEEVERWQTDFLRSERSRFEARVEDGRIREGHGDLRLEHVYFDATNHPTIIDGIEFNQRFRCGDVCSDVAFLSMDLSWHDRHDLAERFLAAYARAANDYDLYSFVDFYESYRAYVRGKIAGMAWANASAPHEARERARADARRCFLLSLASERRPLAPPSLIAVGGIIASGKSTLADALASELCAPVVDTDRTRKHMIGVRPTTRVYDGAWSDTYEPGFTDRVYDEVLRRAAVVLSTGRSVVLDASFRTRRAREQARALAEEHGVPFLFVECTAPHDVCRERLRRRAREVTVSDGRLEIFDAFLARWEPVEELAPTELVRVDTSRGVEQALSELRGRISIVPPPPPGSTTWWLHRGSSG